MARAPALLLALAASALWSCASPTPPCGPGTCTFGCCDTNGACNQTNTALACGTGGEQCKSCVGACVLGACVEPSAGGGSANTGGGSGGGGAGGAGGGGISACSGTLRLCPSGCLDTQSDENNCGDCGHGCDSGQVCDRGQCKLLPMDCSVGGCPAGYGCSPTTRKCEPGCQLASDCPMGATCTANQCACPAQQHACGSQCVSSTDPASCGTSCTACPAPANGTATCDGQGCGFSCNAGTLTCGSACVPCSAPANATATCGANNSCDFTCASGYRRCGSGCVPTSAVTCGSSCTPCTAPANGSAVCTAQSSCSVQCDSGFSLCGGVCAACPANATATACQGSACLATACGPGAHLCAGVCKADNDASACGASCSVCPAGSGMTAVCTQGTCDARCTGTTTCRGRCGATCTWNPYSSTVATSYLDVFVDAQGGVHAASVYQFKPTYLGVSSGSVASEPVSMTNDCFYSPQGSFSSDTAPLLMTDPSSTKPAIACQRGNTMNGYRWDTGTSAWGAMSIYSSTSLDSSVPAQAQSNGVGAFGRYFPSSFGGQQFVDLLTVDSNGWNMSEVEEVSAYVSLSGLSLLRSASGNERIAYREQTISNFTAIDAGVIRVGEKSGGVFTFTDAPWIVTDAFAQERDGTVFAVDRGLKTRRLVNGTWAAGPSIATPSGTVYSLQVLVDPSGIARVVWSDGAGVALASRIGGTWIVERVTSMGCYGARVAVNASGKVAVACSYVGNVLIFD